LILNERDGEVMQKYVCWIFPVLAYNEELFMELKFGSGKRNGREAEASLFAIVHAKSLDEARKKWFYNVYARTENHDIDSYKALIMKWILTIPENWEDATTKLSKACNFTEDEALTIMGIAQTYNDQFPCDEHGRRELYDKAVNELSWDNWDKGAYPHEEINALPLDILLRVWYHATFRYICVASIEHEVK